MKVQQLRVRGQNPRALEFLEQHFHLGLESDCNENRSSSARDHTKSIKHCASQAAPVFAQAVEDLNYCPAATNLTTRRVCHSR